MAQLKHRVVRGVAWTLIEKGGTLVVQMVVNLVLVRLLTPADLGKIGMLAVFSMISFVFIDGGFTQSLIRKEHPTQEDYSTVFFLNLAVGVGIYLLLCALAWPIASFYREPQLIRLAPAIFAPLPIVALITVPQIIFAKAVDFRTPAKISLTATLVSGGVALWMAFAGWGVWAIVWQSIIYIVVRFLYVWAQTSWRPIYRFSKESLRELAGFGSSLFMASLVNQFFTSLMQMFVARIYGAGQFGLYDYSRKLKDIPSETLSSSVAGVTFPALTTLQNRPEKLRESSRKIVIIMSFILFPVMVGMIVTAHEFFPIILTDRWAGAIPYFQVLCLTALTIPTTTVMQNAIKVQGTSRLPLTIELLRKAFALAVMVAVIPFGLKAVVWGQLLYLTFGMGVGMYQGKRLMDYRIGMQLRDLLPVALLTAVMWAGVAATGWFFVGVLTFGWLLLLKVSAGVVIYACGAWLFRIEAWRESREIVQNLFKLRTANHELR